MLRHFSRNFFFQMIDLGNCFFQMLDLGNIFENFDQKVPKMPQKVILFGGKKHVFCL